MNIGEVAKQANMTVEDVGQILLQMTVCKMVKEQEILTHEARKRELPNRAKEFGVDAKKLERLAQVLTPVIIGRITGCTKVSMEGWH